MEGIMEVLRKGIILDSLGDIIDGLIGDLINTLTEDIAGGIIGSLIQSLIEGIIKSLILSLIRSLIRSGNGSLIGNKRLLGDIFKLCGKLKEELYLIIIKGGCHQNQHPPKETHHEYFP